MVLVFARVMAASKDPEALSATQAALAVAPDSGEAHRLHGYALANLARNVEAYDAFERSAKLEPLNALPLVHMVEMLLRDLSDAGPGPDSPVVQKITELADRAVGLDPDSVATHVTAAKAARRRGALDTAEHHLEAANRIDPNNAISHQVRGLIAKDRGDPGQAREHYVTAAKADARSAWWSTRAIKRMDDASKPGLLARLRKLLGFGRGDGQNR